MKTIILTLASIVLVSTSKAQRPVGWYMNQAAQETNARWKRQEEEKKAKQYNSTGSSGNSSSVSNYSTNTYTPPVQAVTPRVISGYGFVTEAGLKIMDREYAAALILLENYERSPEFNPTFDYYNHSIICLARLDRSADAVNSFYKEAGYAASRKNRDPADGGADQGYSAQSYTIFEKMEYNYCLGKSFFDAGKIDSAIIFYSNCKRNYDAEPVDALMFASTVDPILGNSVFGKAQCYLQLYLNSGSKSAWHDEVVEYIHESKRRLPDDPEPVFANGIYEWAQQNYTEAESMITESIDMVHNGSPDNLHSLPFHFLQRAQLRAVLKKYDDALRDVNECLASGSRYEYYALKLRAAINHGMGNLNKSIMDYDSLLNKYQCPAEDYNARGWYKCINHDFKNGLADINRAIQLDSSNYNYYDSRGYALYNLLNFAAAVKDYNRAISMGKENPSLGISYFFRAKTYIALKNIKAACADMQKALQLKVNDTETGATQDAVVKYQLENCK